MTRRSWPISAIVVFSLLMTACSSGATQAPGGSTGPAGGASAPADSGSGPAGSAESSATAGKPISGPLQVGAKYGCKPVPCKATGEGAADEIAVTRYDAFATAH